MCSVSFAMQLLKNERYSKAFNQTSEEMSAKIYMFLVMKQEAVKYSLTANRMS